MRLTTRRLVTSPPWREACGKPTVEQVIQETCFDGYIFDICGVETDTTQTQRTTIKTLPDGSLTGEKLP
jgi:hypothetical protein